MSRPDFREFVDPTRFPDDFLSDRRVSLHDYPPELEPLLGMWSRLASQSFTGLTTDGVVREGLFEHADSGAPVQAAARAADEWLAALAPEERADVCFDLDADEWRSWHNTPGILRSPQLEFGELDEVKRRLALDVVRVSLSDVGYGRSRRVMKNNELLGQLVGLERALNEWTFTLSIFGTPSTVEPWGWQLFGHHLALNCLFAGTRMTISPIFMGAEPDQADAAHANRSIFEPHEDAALRLMTSFGREGREQATLYSSMRTADQPPGRYHPDDGRTVGGAFQDNRIVPTEGLSAGLFDGGSRRLLLALAELFVETLPQRACAVRMEEIERHLADTYFSWIGPCNEVDPFYFRIHSPVVLIEFDHHAGIFLSNQDPQRFHVHTIVRTPNGNDYGRDLLLAHYRTSPAHQRATTSLGPS